MILVTLSTLTGSAWADDKDNLPHQLPDFMPFYFSRGYFNWNGMLTLGHDDIVVGDVFTFPRAAVFFYADLGDPVARAFFDGPYRTIVAKVIERNEAIFILRDKALSPASTAVYRVAQCLPNEYSLPFVRTMLDRQDQWRGKRDIREWLRPAAAGFGMAASGVEDCLADEAALENIKAHAEKAREMRLFRLSRPELYVNQFYFPVIVEEQFFPNALQAALRKLSRKDSVSALKEEQRGADEEFGRRLGAADAPVQLIQYETPESLTITPFLRDILPVLNERYIEKGLLSFELRPFPWFSNGETLLSLLHCAPPDRFFDAYLHMASINGMWLDRHEDWKTNPKLHDLALRQLRSLGISTRTIADCARREPVRRYVRGSRDKLMEENDVFFTPTFFLNGREVAGGHVTEAWIGLIDRAIEESKKGAE